MAVLDFQLEMSGKDMAGRQMSMQLKKSLKELYSAENGRKISDADFEAAVALAKLYNKAPIYYVEKPVTVDEFANRVTRFIKTVKKRTLVTLDHTVLLRRAASEKDMFATLFNLGNTMTELKKKLPVMFLVMTQLNRECEKPERLKDGTAGNYLQLSDIYGSDAMGMHADLVIGLNKPSRMNLAYYGLDRYIVTEDLLAMHVLKNRNGMIGLSFMEADFAKMRISERATPPPKLKTK
jgi:replicative DNA helicase